MTSIMSHNIPFIPFPLPLNFNLLSQTADFNGVLNRNNYFDKRMEEDDDYKSTSTSTSTKSDERMRNSGGGLHGDEDDEDKQSVCSELSVGKEMGDVNCGESSGMKIDVERRLSVSPIMKSKYASTEWSESERGSVATHEETSCDSSRPYSADPQVPVVIRPTPARLQEEFLKSSQVYAEELMRQRIRILAATRSVKPLEQTFGGFLPRLENVIASRSLESEKSPKVGFRPPSADATNFQPQYNPKLPVNVNFHNIHSHLNAISQITQNLNADSHKKSTSSSPAASNLSFRDNSQSPPSGTGNYYNQHHHHSHLSPMNGDANLKFSIDNILKSDFGQQRSGITDPLKRTKTVSRKTQQRQESRQQRQQQANAGKLLDPPTPVATTSKSEPPSDPASVPTKQLPLPNAMKAGEKDESMVWPAWVYCTRYSDRPSSGRSPRVKKPKKAPEDKASADDKDDKRPRTAFNGSQLARLKREFNENRYLTEKRRLALSAELGLNEAQIKIWFQNKRAKIKKSTGQKNPLALQLMAQGLYNHSTIPLTQEEEELQELQAAGKV